MWAGVGMNRDRAQESMVTLLCGSRPRAPPGRAPGDAGWTGMRSTADRSLAHRGAALPVPRSVADHGPWPFGDGGVTAIFERGVQMPSIIP